MFSSEEIYKNLSICLTEVHKHAHLLILVLTSQNRTNSVLIMAADIHYRSELTLISILF